jgi:hypothetical protein
MIKLLKRHQINDISWNTCVKHALFPSINAYTWYLDIVSPQWNALVMGDYKAVLPLPIKKKYSINYLLQPLFTKTLGIYSREEITANTVIDFLDQIPYELKLVDINILSLKPVECNGYEISKKTYQQLDINREYTAICEGYHANVVRNLKKASSNQLSLSYDITVEEIIEMYKNNVGRKLNFIKSKDYTNIKNILYKAEHLMCGFKVGVVNKNRELLATAFIMKTDKSLNFYIGSSNDKGKKAGAISFLFDQLFITHCKRHLFFDFEGSSIASIATFNKKFGAKDYVYLQVKKNKLPLLLRRLKKI